MFKQDKKIDRPKTHPVMSIWNDGRLCAIFTKGEVPLDVMREEALIELDGYGDPTQIVVTHERWRAIPWNMDGIGSVYRRGVGRGSFAVTVASFMEWER